MRRAAVLMVEELQAEAKKLVYELTAGQAAWQACTGSDVCMFAWAGHLQAGASILGHCSDSAEGFCGSGPRRRMCECTGQLLSEAERAKTAPVIRARCMAVGRHTVPDGGASDGAISLQCMDHFLVCSALGYCMAIVFHFKCMQTMSQAYCAEVVS